MRETRRPTRWLVILSPCLLAGCAGNADPNDGEPGVADILFVEDAEPAMSALPFAETELLIQPYPGADDVGLLRLYGEIDASVVAKLAEIGAIVLKVPTGTLTAAGTHLAQSGLIETVQKNYLLEAAVVPDDPLFSSQPHLTAIGAPEAWDISTGAENVRIAIIDSGVDMDHPDLAGKIVDRWNVFDQTDDVGDVTGHGTQVAGAAAAWTNNATGVAGVSWDSPLIIVRATDAQGRASTRHLAAGILWAASRGATAINVSFAPLWADRIVRAASQEAFARGSLVVISAGNTGLETRGSGFAEALFVGATGSAGQAAAFSDRGPFIDLSAPGVGIRTTAAGGGYTIANGTSLSAPITAGVVALMAAVNPALRPVSLQAALLAATIDRGEPGKDIEYGNGALDAAGAVRRTLATRPIIDTTAPAVEIRRPLAGSTVAGRFTTQVIATDRWGVADVVLSIDGVPYATDTRSEYRFVIDADRFPSGRHDLSFVATDRFGNASASLTVTVSFRLALPGTSSSGSDIVFRSPQNGATVSGDTLIQATVADADGLATVEWFVDGVSVLVTAAAGQSSGLSFLWRASESPPGLHTIRLTVTDTRGGRTSDELSLSVR